MKKYNLQKAFDKFEDEYNFQKYSLIDLCGMLSIRDIYYKTEQKYIMKDILYSITLDIWFDLEEYEAKISDK